MRLSSVRTRTMKCLGVVLALNKKPPKSRHLGGSNLVRYRWKIRELVTALLVLIAVFAVNGLVVARHKWHGGLFATTSTGGRELLTRTAVTAIAVATTHAITRVHL